MKIKFYAYLLPDGRHSVVNDWKKCEKIVSGVFGARFKGFRTKEEAEKWLMLGARYEIKNVKRMKSGVYFDAGTGRGEGVEISVTDEHGKDLLHRALSKKYLNRFGKSLVGRDATNNYGELLAMKYAIQIAMKEGIRKVFGDSRLVIDYWTKWHVKKDVAPETLALAREVAKLRAEFEKHGGEVIRISGDDNPADLGFHR